MTDPALAARTLLWEWARERDDPDPEQRGWKVAYCAGLVDACEHTGLLGPDEIAAWRRLLADPGASPPPASGDRRAAEGHLDALLAAVPPMSRDPQPAALAPSRRFHGALAALHAVGVLGDEDQETWRSRALAAEAPWLDREDVDQLSRVDGIYAISIPPASPEEEAADAAAERDLEALVRRGRVRSVFVSDRVERHDGLAVVAVVTRTESTDVVFNHVGDPVDETASGRASLRAFQTTVDALVAPALSDDAGTVYEPLRQQPMGSHGNRGAITGAWRYQPPAPDAAATFDVGAGAARWHVRRA